MMIEKPIVQLLNSGLTRKQVFKKLRGQDDDDEIIYFVNCYCTLADKKKYMLLNLILIGLLVFVTGRKAFEVAGYSAIDMMALSALVVPLVNVYIIRKLLYFHKNGYKFLFILTVLSLVHKENHTGFGLVITLAMIVLSGFLYKKFFNKENLLPEIDD